MDATARRTGISFAPHDCRRTVITQLLRNGAPLADVQAQAGHARPETTLRYARATDAEQRRTRFRTDW